MEAIFRQRYILSFLSRHLCIYFGLHIPPLHVILESNPQQSVIMKRQAATAAKQKTALSVRKSAASARSSEKSVKQETCTSSSSFRAATAKKVSQKATKNTTAKDAGTLSMNNSAKRTARTVYVASMNMRGAWAEKPPSKRACILNVTSMQAKDHKHRRDFSPLYEFFFAAGKTPKRYEEFYCFENYWQAGKVYEGVDQKMHVAWWKKQKQGRRRCSNRLQGSFLHGRIYLSQECQESYITVLNLINYIMVHWTQSPCISISIHNFSCNT